LVDGFAASGTSLILGSVDVDSVSPGGDRRVLIADQPISVPARTTFTHGFRFVANKNGLAG